MADKRIVRRNLKRLQVVKTWQLIILLILMAFVAATFLRLNNTGMVTRRNAVAAADSVGNQDDTTNRIYDLQRYSAAHMNADTGVFYLQDTYDRDVKEIIARASNSSNEGSNSPQAKADAICNPHLNIHGYSQAYQNCMIRELSKAGQVVDPSAIQLPSPSLYRYSFVSPLWSPDFAGWSVLICSIIALIIAVRFVTMIVLRVLLRRRYRAL